MTISDFLVLVTIVLTLVTIAVSNNKKICCLLYTSDAADEL